METRQLKWSSVINKETSSTLTATDIGYDLGNMGFIQLDASKSSAVYVGSKVQMSALAVLVCIKV